MNPIRRMHKCEHQDCTKQTKARFCEEHLPTCIKCNKKCRKFEDPAKAVCFQHSEYLREKTREKVARYRAIKRDRKLACRELAAIVQPLIDAKQHYYLEHVAGGVAENGVFTHQEWHEFIRWLRENHEDVWDKYDKLGCSCNVIDTLSGMELREYTDRMIAHLAGDTASC